MMEQVVLKVSVVMCLFGHSVSNVTDLPVTTPNKKEQKMQRSVLGNNRTIHTLGRTSNHGNCSLSAMDHAFRDKVTALIEGGAKLINYNVDFDQYQINPLLKGNRWAFRPHRWGRAATRQGITLITFCLNYGAMSLTTLTFGVHNLDVRVRDMPFGCILNISEKEKVDLVRDFLASEDHSSSNYYRLCHQVVVAKRGEAHFLDRCCYHAAKSNKIICQIEEGNFWQLLLQYLLIFIRVYMLLVGPTYIPKSLYSHKFERYPYIVKLNKSTHKTICMVTSTDASRVKGKVTIDLRKSKSGFENCNQKAPMMLRPGEVTQVAMSQYDLAIDYSKLVTEKNIPVGFWNRMRRFIFNCKIKNAGTFQQCCQSDVCGRNTPKLRWINVCKPIGKFLLVLFIPTPYYLRLLVYFFTEKPEIAARKEAADRLGLLQAYDWRLVSYLSPLHPVWIALYGIYFITCLILSTPPHTSDRDFISHVRFVAYSGLSSLHAMKRLTGVNAILNLLLWPFDRFGFFGVFVGLLFWPIALPICLIFFTLYVIPLLYLLVRILVGPEIEGPEPPTNPNYSFLRNTTGRNILNKRQGIRTRLKSLLNIFQKVKVCQTNLAFNDGMASLRLLGVKHSFYQLIARLLCIVSLLGTMVVFTECVGFIADMVTLTLMGVLANAQYLIKHITILLMILFYCYDVFNEVSKTYLSLNAELFKEIQSRVEGLESTIGLKQSDQENNGFIINNTEIPDDENLEDGSNIHPDHIQAKYYANPKQEDKIYWYVNDLGLFVDRKDTPRIPCKLFEEVCKIQVCGAPGPIYVSHMKALMELAFIVMFLLFVFVIILALGEESHLSSGSKVIATVIGGLIPYLFKTLLKAKPTKIKFDSLKFKSRLNETITACAQKWPLYDLHFDLVKKEPVSGCNGENHLKDCVGGEVNKDTSENEENNDKDVLIPMNTYNQETVDILLVMGKNKGTDSLVSSV